MPDVESCYFCHRPEPIAAGVYTTITLPDAARTIVALCDTCRERGEEAENRDRDEEDA